MEKFSIDIENINSPKYKRSKLITIFLGIIWTVNGIIFLLKNSEFNFLGFFYILTGPHFIIIPFFQKNIENNFKISFDEKNIFSKTSIFKSFSASWENLSRIKILNLKIELYTKANTKHEIKLDLLSYNNLRLVKEKFIEAAKIKNIQIN